MKLCLATLLLAVGCSLSACDQPISTNNQPITGDHPAPVVDSAAALDTAAPVSGSVPFVNPGRAASGRGIKHPSPPASRTR